MSILTYGSFLGGIRKKLKAQNVDSWLTDQQLWTLVKPYVSETMKELDGKSRIMGFNSIFQTLDKIDLIEVDNVEASCSGIKSGIRIKRTKKPIPVFMEGYMGPLIKSITSLDGAIEVNMTTSEAYNMIVKQKSYKYLRNDNKYCWYLNDHFYFPDIDWPFVKMVAVTEEDVSEYKCDDSERCLPRQQQSLNIPDYIIGRIYDKLFKSMGIFLQEKSDPKEDGESPIR